MGEMLWGGAGTGCPSYDGEEISLGTSFCWGWGAFSEVPVIEDKVFGLGRMGFEFGFFLEAGVFAALVGDEEARLLGLIEGVEGLDGREGGGIGIS